MSGEKDLGTLLRSMRPHLNEGEYVFCTLGPGIRIDPNEVVGCFREEEGMTAILRREIADRNGWPYNFIAAWITLTVHSALDAVGLTAAFSSALGKEGISCNVIAAYHHDHIFVQADDKGRAMAVLEKLASGGQAS